MKKTYLLILTLLAGVFTMNAQQSTNSPKVMAAFSQQQISSMSQDDLAWKNFIADNMCIIGDVTADKAAGFTSISVGNQSAATTATFNPLLLNIQPLEHDNQYFIIEGTSRTLFVYSKDRLNVMYQRAQLNKK